MKRIGIFLAVLFTTVLCIKVDALASTISGVDYHSQEEIRAYISEHKDALDYNTSFSKSPSASQPYSLGAVSSETQNKTIELLNIIRYVAGVPYNVSSNASHVELAQAAALINAAGGGGLSHSPTKPGDMDNALYELGYRGASSSNLAAGRNLCSALKYGWMSDSGPSNISRIGHRRWCLNPTMGQVGFGEVNNPSSAYGTYTAMYAFDRSNYEGFDYKNVAWPAQNTPVELFQSDVPWSISLGQSVDADTVKVVLKRINDGKSYSFSTASADGAFYVNNEGYGQSGCIIFRPSDGTICEENYTYEVSVKGNYYFEGSFNINYQVNFFSATKAGVTPTTPTKPTVSGWRNVDGYWYYYDANGNKKKGWLKSGGKWYYLDKTTGAMAKNKWISGIYYVKADGAMATNEWVSGKYYVGADGKWDKTKSVTADWKKTNGKWWYQNADGTYPKSKWQKINGKWYHFDSKGYMQTGWLKDGEKWYYLEAGGAMASNKWIAGIYYVKTNGTMATDEWVGGKYYVDGNGKWVKDLTRE